LEFLTWLGSIVTAAIVHLFHDVERLQEARTWWMLPIVVFGAEHVYLGVQVRLTDLLFLPAVDVPIGQKSQPGNSTNHTNKLTRTYSTPSE
jgi:hypothetical protein